ncbi:PKD domain-containing protein [bacterium]|nr:PKD domain-containing protein [bacterium]
MGQILSSSFVRVYCFTVIFIAVISYSALAQCTISASQNTGCAPQPITFLLKNSGGKPIKSITWDFGDSQNSTDESPTHVYKNRGKYKVSVSVKFADNSSCNASYNNDIQIFDKPDAKLVLNNLYKKCWYDKGIEIAGNATAGADNAAIKKYTWDLGDGDTSNYKKFVHEYEKSGSYKIKLEVEDANGCKDTVSKRIEVYIYDKIKPNYIKFQKDSCPETHVTFRNKTDSNGWDVEKVEWDFGNGKKQIATTKDVDWATKWDRASTIYLGNKTYYPKLTITNKAGCVVEISRYSPSNIFFKFNISASETATCYDHNGNGPMVIFEQPEIPGYRRVVWNFGDPGSSDNEAGSTFNPRHEYSEPGTFTVSLHVEVKGCVRDTHYCAMVYVPGPAAKINKFPHEYNDSLIGHKFYPNTFPDNFDTCNINSFDYWTLDSALVKRKHFEYCNAKVLDSMPQLTLKKCKGYYVRYKYKLKPTKTTTYNDYEVKRVKHTWQKGDPLPTEKVFNDYIGKNIPENLHDSLIFSCEVPHTVPFINNTIKYRGHHAIDDFPGLLADVCRNPSYPWASDSLDYFWDFGEGTHDTSSASKPLEFAQYSTERLPVHTYTTEGCYTVKLTAIDPVTGCISKDSMKLIVQHPDAGWDTVAFPNITRMNYRTQQRLNGTGARRGFILKGLECINYGQSVDKSEMLPDCLMERYWVVFDSAAQTTYGVCNGKKVLRHSWVMSKKVPEHPLAYTYSDTGWVTVGVVVKAGDCFDTMWYHNYKYIYGASSAFTVSQKHTCTNTNVSFHLNDTTQEGIKYAWFTYEYKENPDSDWVVNGGDTITYLKWNDKGNMRFITSTMDNPSVKIKDDTFYNNLSEVKHFAIKGPGIYRITSHVLHRFGCEYTDFFDVGVGHLAKFSSDLQRVCIGDTVEFLDTVRYYSSFSGSQDNSGFDTTLYWKDPEGTRNGHKTTFPEEIKWDFDNDGVIDYHGSNPIWIYNKPGVYTVKMYTRDSLGCEWIETIKPDYIVVSAVKASFGLDGGDSVRFCAPQLTVFQDKSKVIDGKAGVLDTIQYWQWSWGDGEDALKSQLEDGKVGHLYEHNGTYKVWLKTYLKTYQTTHGMGCVDSQLQVIQIIGPLPKFKLIGDSVGCMPFVVHLKDSSTRVSVWEWQLGDGRTKSTKGEKNVDLTYDKPGIYCISVQVGDSIVDYKNDTLYCVDFYPYNKCEIKVRVLPKNKIKMIGDSSICLHGEAKFSFEKSDTSYKTFSVYYGDDSDTLHTDKTNLNHWFHNKQEYKIFYTGQGAPCPDTAYRYLNTLGVTADFLLDSSRLDTPLFNFKNLSEGGTEYDWSFDGDPRITYTNADVQYEYHATGTKEICLIALNDIGCADTLCKWLKIHTNIWIPNVLTPDNNGFNDRFKILIEGELYYDLHIYNRWGELVFESTEFNYLWNGNKFNTKEPCLPGTYFYIFKYQLIGEGVKVTNGSVTLIR